MSAESTKFCWIKKQSKKKGKNRKVTDPKVNPFGCQTLFDSEKSF